MSDTFDHYMDAIDQDIAMGGDGSYGRRSKRSRQSYTFVVNRLYYHERVRVLSRISETEKSVLMKLHGWNQEMPLWIPKTIIREKDGGTYIHRRTLIAIEKTAMGKEAGHESKTS